MKTNIALTIVWQPNCIVKIIDELFTEYFCDDPFKYWRSNHRSFTMNKNKVKFIQAEEQIKTADKTT